MTYTASSSAAEGADKAARRVARQELDGSQSVGVAGRTLLGLFLMSLGLVLIYFVIALWPAVQAAAAKSEGSKTIHWFRWSYEPTPEAALLILVVLVSSLGSYVHAAVSFTDFVGNRRLMRSWMWWYFLRVFVGSSLALIFYFAIRGGFMGADTTSDQINPYGIAAVSGLVGLFSKQATDKLREIFDTAFRTAPGYGDDAREGAVVNPMPELTGAEPPRLTVGGDLTLTLVGSGFTADSQVRAVEGGEDVPRSVRYVSPTRLGVTLEPTDAADAGVLRLAVVNPEPGGGSSRTLEIYVDPAETETEADSAGNADAAANDGTTT